MLSALADWLNNLFLDDETRRQWQAIDRYSQFCSGMRVFRDQDSLQSWEAQLSQLRADCKRRN